MNQSIRPNFTIPAQISNAVVQRYFEKQDERQAKVAHAKVAHAKVA